MEKMNQVSVSEFMSKSAKEIYDNVMFTIEKYNRLADICNDSAERIAILVKENERRITYADELNKDIAKKAVKIELLEQEIEGRKEGYWALKEKYDKLEKEFEIRTKENEILIAVKNRQEKELEAHDAELKGIVKSKEYWRTKYLATQEERDAFMEDAEALRTANEILVEKSKEHLDEIKKLKEEIEGRKKAFNDLREETANRYIAIETHNDICKTYEKDLDYYKNQERIRTSQLRATESKVDELWKEIEKLTKGEEDDYGKSGFKRYIEHLIEEEERAVPERFKERLNKEITEIFTKEEETVKYRPSEIDRFVNFLKDEVDKKHIVDIRYGVEDDLHVTRDLLVAAVKLIVAKGYHEYEGVTTDYGRFHVLTTPDVEFKDLYDTWKIKSIGPYTATILRSSY